MDGLVGGQQKTLPETDQGGEICASPMLHEERRG